MGQERVLVVGGAGYIGSHVSKALIEAGHQSVIFDNLSTGHKENILPESTFIEGDILDLPALQSAMADITAVVHLAALKAAGDSMKDPHGTQPKISAVPSTSSTHLWRPE